MAKKNMHRIRPSQLLLGEKLQELRVRKGLTCKQLGRMVNVLEQQIIRYESGHLVPMAMLEKLTKAMGEPIQKKWIRRISSLRHRAIDMEEEPAELSELYAEIFSYEDE